MDWHQRQDIRGLEIDLVLCTIDGVGVVRAAHFQLAVVHMRSHSVFPGGGFPNLNATPWIRVLFGNAMSECDEENHAEPQEARFNVAEGVVLFARHTSIQEFGKDARGLFSLHRSSLGRYLMGDTLPKTRKEQHISLRRVGAALA